MAINAIGNGIPFPKGIGIPYSIKNNMVLWYDIKRQGATNETMKANPILKDLSGNGHDATCYNFAWSGMSSIGGYITDYTKYTNNISVGAAEVYSEKIIITNINKNTNLIEITNKSTSIPSYKIKVTGISKNAVLAYINNGTKFFNMNSDGEYTLPATSTIYSGFRVLNMLGECNIVIEQIPEYPNALVSDGVDDYVKVEGLPILTDYTVIAKRKILSEPDGTYKAFAAKGSTVHQGAFILERQNYITEYEIYNFGQLKYLTEIPTDITYMTSSSYNGNPIAKGDGIDEDIVCIFSRFDQNQCISAVLYSFILFNRTLTTKEINWVKHNLIEGDIEI